MEVIEISVTENDIREGGRCGDDCPIWLAAIRAFRHRDIWVSRVDIRARGDLYNLPPVARSFIRKLGESSQVEPFAFNVELLNPAHLESER